MFTCYLQFLALFVFLVSLPCIGSGSDTGVKLTPEKIFPGDAFLIEVKSAETPSGSVEGVWLAFFTVADGSYRAISSVDMEAEPGEYTIRLVADGKFINHTFTVYEKKFPVQKLTLRSDKVFLSPEDQARADREDKKLNALWNETTERAWKARFIPPLDTSISSPFGVVRIMNQKVDSRHRGTDYRGYTGKPARAINSGVVVLAEELFYGGNTVMIDHGGRIFSIYMHLSEFKVGGGEAVERGDVVGLVGSTGRATGPHLHLSVKIGGRSANPESLFALPLD